MSLYEKASQLPVLSDADKNSLLNTLQEAVLSLRKPFWAKAMAIIKIIPLNCHLDFISAQHRQARAEHPKRYHPVSVVRGEIYNAFITESIGSELKGNHLVIVISNTKANIYSEKVNVIVIEGDGNKVNKNYQMAITNDDLDNGKFNKNPSRIIISDILTIDKARLDTKIGRVKKEKMDEIGYKLKKQLEL